MKLDSPRNIASDMRRTTIPLIAKGLKLWPFAHLITYGVIPESYRLAWVDLVEILWVTILATQAAAAGRDRAASNPNEDR
jgi:protein Mpv17